MIIESPSENAVKADELKQLPLVEQHLDIIRVLAKVYFLQCVVPSCTSCSGKVRDVEHVYSILQSPYLA